MANPTKNEFLGAVSNSSADRLLVRIINREMAAKLTHKRAQGRGGWWLPNPDIGEALQAQLLEHMDKGDMLDVINLAAMIHIRGRLYPGK